MQKLKHINDVELIEGLARVVKKQRTVTVELLVYLGEVDVRRLYLEHACPSLFVYCAERLGFSEDEACKRIGAARAARVYPIILELLEQGLLHVSGVNLLAQHLTPDNHLELLTAAKGLSKRAIEELIAKRFSKPDATFVLRRLPLGSDRLAANTKTENGERAGGERAGGERLTLEPAAANGPTGDDCRQTDTDVRDKTLQVVSNSNSALRLEVQSVSRALSPLSEQRYRLQLTLSKATHDKFKRAQALMRHANPKGDVAEVLDRALTLLCQKLEAKQFAKRQRAAKMTTETDAHSNSIRPGADKGPANDGVTRQKPSRYIHAQTKRQVAERDGLQCAFQDNAGNRCQATSFLQLHHVKPFAKGGPSTADNLRIFCASHNQYQGRKDFSG